MWDWYTEVVSTIFLALALHTRVTGHGESSFWWMGVCIAFMLVRIYTKLDQLRETLEKSKHN